MKCSTCGVEGCMAHGGMMKPMMAEGGEMPPDMDHDGDMDDELNGMVAEELLHAIEHKDKNGILEAIRALVMSCGGK